MRRIRIRFSDESLDDLRQRLGRTRLPPDVPGSGWNYGTALGPLRDVLEYWRTEYDWRRSEAWLDSLPNLKAPLAALGGREIHFVHVRSRHPRAFPLVVMHGWPGSVFEFDRFLERLADPPIDGGRPEDAFDVVAPSLPGFGLSDAPPETGFDIGAVGRAVAELMEKLGYESFGTQGGDWGAMASPYVALAAPKACRAMHLNMVLAPRPQGEDPETTLSEKEYADLLEARAYMRDGTGYQAIQSTRPQTLGYALNDSPAGLAAWILEKFRAWSDCDGDPAGYFGRDRLLANVTWYWLTETAASSARLYFESKKAGTFGPVNQRVETPAGIAVFPKEMFRPPRRWVERLYRVERWTEMPRGGHFAAMEAPEILAEDVRAFFRAYR